MGAPTKNATRPPDPKERRQKQGKAHLMGRSESTPPPATARRIKSFAPPLKASPTTTGKKTILLTEVIRHRSRSAAAAPSTTSSAIDDDGEHPNYPRSTNYLGSINSRQSIPRPSPSPAPERTPEKKEGAGIGPGHSVSLPFARSTVALAREGEGTRDYPFHPVNLLCGEGGS